MDTLFQLGNKYKYNLRDNNDVIFNEFVNVSDGENHTSREEFYNSSLLVEDNNQASQDEFNNYNFRDENYNDNMIIDQWWLNNNEGLY